MNKSKSDIVAQGDRENNHDHKNHDDILPEVRHRLESDDEWQGSAEGNSVAIDKAVPAAARDAGSHDAEDAQDTKPSPYSGKRERRFLFKLDVYLITWAFLAYLIKQIDSGNYRTAYASGMKEDMNMYGNELNYMDTTFRIGYAVFLIPSQLILTRIRPKYWLPPLELAWGVMTGLMAVSSSVQGMYVLRFFIGVFEASSYPGIVSVLCSWYTPSELATRLAIFSTSYPAASMFVSTMQVAIQSTLHGAHGIAGWRWLFIFNAIMTVIVAAMGFLMVPDRPGDAHVLWMTEEDEAISTWRMTRVNKLPPTKLSWATVKETFSGWLLYVFTFAYAFWGWCTNSNLWIILFLKAETNPDGSLRFNVQEINAIPIGGYALMLVCMLGFAWASSKTGHRALWIVAQMVPHLIGLIILSIWPPGFAAKMVGYFLCWTSMGAGPILIAWMADWCPSPEKRNIIVGVCVSLVYAVDSFANIFIYPAKEAPKYRIGYKAALAFGIASLVFVGVFAWKDRSLSKAQKQRLAGESVEGIDTESPRDERMPTHFPEQDQRVPH